MTTKKKSKPKTVAGVTVEHKTNKTSANRTSYSKAHPSPHAFQPGESGNVGGKAHHADALLSRSLRVDLASRAPDDVAAAFKLGKGASWSMCIARKLIFLAVHGDLGAVSEIRNFTESAHVSLDFPDSSSPVPLIELVFVSSDGAGHPAPGQMIDGMLPAPLELPAEVSD